VCLAVSVCVYCVCDCICVQQRVTACAAHLWYAASLGISLVLLGVACCCYMSGGWRHTSPCAMGWQHKSACGIGGISGHVPSLLTSIWQQAFTSMFGH